ncbi:MAG: sigma-70 family RNA polymerase sigma factor [Phycisphaerae bacterium]|nr:sigma-70 family RNA polymerase sigma factor [Phycisphaerae bacterium]NIP50445.1 sigma-70 family RNA polymerase sigma factor [Phycisphaerae bacterium]NIS49573.1 sigma-70 family RNA polymerase sigma factor [Phycisphaerae bacterium]NIU07331.1 sigma-70 family RNA polymerase sigma factor [Phycisphaerae bacterium]NIU54900.1 sigma-70 family RNA polymerase sigma factor [Phycisphaerae bacterium]
MDEDKDYIVLVRQAQLGSRESLETLAKLVRARLYAYVYRIVLREHLAQDIVQESMLEMFKVLGKLQRADRFWPWLRGIAFNKIRRHYTEEKHRRTVPVSKLHKTQRWSKEAQAGFAKLVSEELKQIVISTMGELKPQYRKVLIMRCYEEMEYSEIAELMGCSELSSRVLFCRAKRSLQKHLSNKGFRKGFLVTALVLFGKMTAPSEAAAAGLSITSAATKVGVAAGVAAAVSSKTAIVSLTAAGVLAVGAVVTTTALDETRNLPENKPVKSLQITGQVDPVQGGIEERWYYYPQNVDGPVVLRLVNWDSQRKKTYGRWWQDDRANYCFVKNNNTIYINNFRMFNSRLDVQTLPTDDPGFIDFVSTVEGQNNEMKYVSGRGEGLLVITRRGGEENGDQFRIVQHNNVLDEEYFRYKWPPEAQEVDNRDMMHKRGWTYFQITGQIAGKEVGGRGRIPFLYAASGRHWPWIVLKVGDNVVNQASFAGLGRPWMGLHTIDTVRRDAGRKWVWFETRYTPDEVKVQVLVTYRQVKLIYTINMEKDVIEKITFLVENDHRGELHFIYLQEIDNVGSEFAEPRRQSDREPGQEGPGILWLIRLIESQMS